MKTSEQTQAAEAAVTRRQLLVGGALGIGTLSMAGKAWAAATDPAGNQQDSVPDGLKTALHQEIEIHASPERIYDALLNSKKFTEFSGAPAEISAKAGGVFSMFGGRITGRNVELVKDQRIVQAWRSGTWPPGVYSIVKFEIKPMADKTVVVLDHTGFPAGDFESLGGGWTGHYWEPMKKYFMAR